MEKICVEVSVMDEMEKAQQPEEGKTEETSAVEETPKEGYVPRPAWQVWGARVALVLFIALLILYYANLLKG